MHSKALKGFLCALLLSAAAFASIPVTGGGTLSYTTIDEYGNCVAGKVFYNVVIAIEYTNFSYTDPSGVVTSFPGATALATDQNQCLKDYPGSVTLTSPTVVVYFTGNMLNQTTASLSSVTGYVNPKYMVVGVTYAPPGPSTNTFVQYQKSTFVGMTQSVSHSFTSSNTNSVSLSYGFNIPLVASGKITNTYSTTNSQMTKNTSTVTTSMQVQSGEETFGTGNYFAPVDNDYDIIWIWLNPVAIFTIYTGNSVPVWNGYGFDGTDQSTMDIVGIPLGYLNGDFGTMPPQYATSLARSWAAKQIWPAGQGPGLTGPGPNTDLAAIAATDPFSVSTYGLDEIGYIPPSPETADHRFTLSACSSQASFNYDQAAPSTSAPIYTCQLTYTNLSTLASEIQTTYAQTFSVDNSFSGSGFLKAFSADLSSKTELTWQTDAQSSITTSTTSIASFSVQGPPCNNVIQNQGPCVPVYDSSGTQPTQFDVYQDNMYGTFMFAPVHYY